MVATSSVWAVVPAYLALALRNAGLLEIAGTAAKDAFGHSDPLAPCSNMGEDVGPKHEDKDHILAQLRDPPFSGTSGVW